MVNNKVRATMEQVMHLILVLPKKKWYIPLSQYMAAAGDAGGFLESSAPRKVYQFIWIVPNNKIIGRLGDPANEG